MSGRLITADMYCGFSKSNSILIYVLVTFVTFQENLNKSLLISLVEIKVKFSNFFISKV